MNVTICAPGASRRVPILECIDALRGLGVDPSVEDPESVEDVDNCLATLEASDSRLIVAGNDAVVRAIVGRMARRATPKASVRPADLPESRTLYDLPAVGILPMEEPDGLSDLVDVMGLSRDPQKVAQGVVLGESQRYDLLKSEGGIVTLHGALLGSALETGHAVSWRAHIAVDGAILSDGDESLIACAIINVTRPDATEYASDPLPSNAQPDGYTQVWGIPLVKTSTPLGGAVSVGVAVSKGTDVEIRRAQGRAVEVVPREDSVPYTVDGVDGELKNKRTWWVEPGAWGVFHTP